MEVEPKGRVGFVTCELWVLAADDNKNPHIKERKQYSFRFTNTTMEEYYHKLLFTEDATTYRNSTLTQEECKSLNSSL
jgi:hypothetical protein